jgi:hypothetical protein
MKIKYLVLVVNLAILLTGCIDEIKLNIDTDQQKIVVDGLIADSLQDYTIKVNYSAVIGIGTDDLKTPVTGATVRVLDDVGGSFDFPETKPGIYTRQMKGEAGKAYHVEVVTSDGKTILSRPSVLSKSPPLSPATARVVEEATISPTGRTLYERRLLLEMNTDVSDLTDRPFLRWRAAGEYEFGEDYPGIIDRKICYVKHNIDFNNIKIFDSNDLEGGLLANEPFLNIKYDYRFAYMYCFHLFQYSISEEEYKYWAAVRDIVNISGNLLDPPPGTVRGNLYNPADPNDQILGYFSVAGVNYRRQFTNAIELSVPAPPKCGGWPPQQPPECQDCTKILSSTVQRPVYWEP